MCGERGLKDFLQLSCDTYQNENNSSRFHCHFAAFKTAILKFFVNKCK
jgi:hypothetical protein